MFISLTATAFACKAGVDPKVENDFNNKFSDALEVSWTTGSNFYKAAFNSEGTWLHAWYNTKGEYLGLTRNINAVQLPFLLQNNLKKNYAQYWITSVVEETGTRGYNYYITLENADQKIVLRSKNGSNWEIYHKQNKS